MSTKISELPALVGAIPETNDIPIVSSGTTYKATLGTVASESTVPIAKGGTGAITAANAAVAIVNGNPINPSSTGGITPGVGTFSTLNIGGSTANDTRFISETSYARLVTGDGTAHKRMKLTGVWTGTSNDGTARTGDWGGYSPHLSLGLGSRIIFESTANITAAGDAGISRSAAGVIQINTGTSGSLGDLMLKNLEAYGTYTSATNYERLKFCYNSSTSTFQIGTEKGSGGGTARNLEFLTNGTVRARFDTSGNFVPNSDNTGALGTNSFRWNNLRVSTDVICTRIGHYSSLGAFSFVDGSGFDWGRLCFGGTTASYPAIKRNAATMDFVLGNDSGYTAVQSLYQRFGSGSPEGVVTAPVGAIYHNTTGGTKTSVYVKESDGTGNTGWHPIRS
jgi:hypothetical protein